MVNPAAAERKRLEKKQAARNKEQKSKAQETATIKRDTRGLEKDVAELEQKAKAGPLARGDREQLEALREELAKIKKAKDAYIEQHPEHKKFVYPHSEQEAAAGAAAAGGASAKPIIARNGLPRYPERSVYYHPIFNPSGAAPPGMPYMEKPPNEWPGTSAHPAGTTEEEQEEDEDEIAMPEGPAPEADSSEADSGLEDIVMPEGPPPPKPPTGPRAMNAPAQLQPPMMMPGAPGTGPQGAFYAGPPPPIHSTAPQQQAPYSYNIPPPGYGLPGVYMGPPPPMHPMQGQRGGHRGGGPGGFCGGPPRGRGGGRGGHSSHHHQQQPPAGAEIITVGPQPAAGSQGPGPVEENATISAAPQLRDLKREAAGFVPAAVRKKQATEKARKAMSLPSKGSLNIAPSDANESHQKEGEGEGEVGGLLKSIAGPLASRQAGDDEYAKYVESMQGLL